MRGFGVHQVETDDEHMNLERLFGPVIVLQRLIVKEHAMDVRRSLMVFIGLLEVVIPVSAQTNGRWAGPSNADLKLCLQRWNPYTSNYTAIPNFLSKRRMHRRSWPTACEALYWPVCIRPCGLRITGVPSRWQ